MKIVSKIKRAFTVATGAAALTAALAVGSVTVPTTAHAAVTGECSFYYGRVLYWRVVLTLPVCRSQAARLGFSYTWYPRA